MPKMNFICIHLIYFKVISKKGGHYCPRLPYTFPTSYIYIDARSTMPKRILLMSRRRSQLLSSQVKKSRAS